MTKPKGSKSNWIVLLLCIVTATMARAQTFETLLSFDGTNGNFPMAVTLVQGTDGDLFGTTSQGGISGAFGVGTAFRMTPTGALTTIYNFCPQQPCTNGSFPPAGLVQATNGSLYGVTSQGGANGDGTVFKITAGGALTTLYSFCAQPNCADGYEPYAGLIQGTNGDLYGTTFQGGANGHGTVFRITLSGTFTTLYSFCAQANCADGSDPAAGPYQATDGDLYGTTSEGGAQGYGGTVFKITPSGTLTTLYSFCQQTHCADGNYPVGGIVEGANGDFYGTTAFGGANNEGTVFEMTPDGQLTVLYSFCAQSNCSDGANPDASMILATDGNFYGTTSADVTNGGDHGYGTLFAITPNGVLTTLHNFDYYNDGGGPLGGLVQDTDGSFYGVTPIGGANLFGTVFNLSTGLHRFVKTLPGSGKIGQEVGILGTDLTGATAVTFNHTPAEFTIKSPTLILTHVPAGAKTGTVQVTLSGGMLSSNAPFYVIP